MSHPILTTATCIYVVCEKYTTIMKISEIVLMTLHAETLLAVAWSFWKLDFAVVVSIDGRYVPQEVVITGINCKIHVEPLRLALPRNCRELNITPRYFAIDVEITFAILGNNTLAVSLFGGLPINTLHKMMASDGWWIRLSWWGIREVISQLSLAIMARLATENVTMKGNELWSIFEI